MFAQTSLKNDFKSVATAPQNQAASKLLPVGLDTSSGLAVFDGNALSGDVINETRKYGWDIPCVEPGFDSLSFNRLISENSFGPNSFKCGRIENYLRRVVIKAKNGQEVLLEPCGFDDLQRKMSIPNFEGMLYRKIYDFIIRNYDEIRAVENVLLPNNLRWPIWSVWNRKVFDLSKIFLGAGGQFGAISRAEFRLGKKYRFEKKLWFEIKSPDVLPDIYEACEKNEVDGLFIVSHIEGKKKALRNIISVDILAEEKSLLEDREERLSKHFHKMGGKKSTSPLALGRIIQVAPATPQSPEKFSKIADVGSCMAIEKKVSFCVGGLSDGNNFFVAPFYFSSLGGYAEVLATGNELVNAIKTRPSKQSLFVEKMLDGFRKIFSEV